MNNLEATSKHFLHIHFTGIHQVVPVQFADEASKAFGWVRDTYGFGGSDMRGKCGQITDEAGTVVGRISYNGRIWDANNNPIDGLVGRAWLESRIS